MTHHHLDGLQPDRVRRLRVGGAEELEDNSLEQIFLVDVSVRLVGVHQHAQGLQPDVVAAVVLVELLHQVVQSPDPG